MATNQTNTSTMYLVSAIFSGIAAILLTFTDFGGFYYYEYYGVGSYFEMWIYVFLFSNLLYTILVLKDVISGSRSHINIPLNLRTLAAVLFEKTSRKI